MPNAAIVKHVHQILLNDRKFKLRELGETVGISIEQSGYILPNLLEMKKLLYDGCRICCRQKTAVVDDSTTGSHCCSVIKRTFSI